MLLHEFFSLVNKLNSFVLDRNVVRTIAIDLDLNESGVLLTDSETVLHLSLPNRAGIRFKV